MKRKLRNLLLTCLLGALALGLMGCGGKGEDGKGEGGDISLGGGTTINLNDYLTIETSGYDTLGEAKVVFDKEAFKADYADKIKVKVADNNGSALDMNMELEYGTAPIDVLKNYCIEFEVSKVNELSNGDTINITWNCDDAKAKEYFGCNLQYTNIEHKVEGLEEVAIFNPFDYATVEFSGEEPHGELSIIVDDTREEMKYLNLEVAYKSEIVLIDLENGDTIEIVVNVKDGVDSFIEKFNSVPSPLSMEFTVKGLSHVASSSTEIDEVTFETLKQTAEAFYVEECEARHKDYMIGYQGMTYVGNYFLSYSGYYPNNILYMIYKVDFEWEGEFYPHYVCIEFNNITIDEAGNCVVNLETCSLTLDKWSPIGDTGSFYYYGYGSIEEFYEAKISYRESSYTIENNVTE